MTAAKAGAKTPRFCAATALCEFFELKDGLDLADRRVVVVHGDAAVEAAQHRVGLGVEVADLAEDFADDQRPHRLGAVLELEGDAQALLLEADAVDAVCAALRDDVRVVVDKRAEVTGAAHHVRVFVDAGHVAARGLAQRVVADRVDAREVFVSDRDVLHRVGENRHAAAVDADDDLVLRVFGERAHRAQHLVLTLGADLPVILHVAAHLALDQHQRRVLAAAVVVELRFRQARADAVLVRLHRAGHGRLHDEVLRVEPGLSHDRFKRVDVEGFAEVRAGEEHGLLVGEAVFLVEPVRDDRQRLHGLRGGAVVNDRLRVARRVHNLAVFIDNADVAVMRQVQKAAAVFFCQKSRIQHEKSPFFSYLQIFALF